MIGILIVAHGSLADSLVECAAHLLGQRPRGLATLDFKGHADPDERQKAIQARLAELDEGDGILVLTDVYGATPAIRAACSNPRISKAFPAPTCRCC
jgi:PTS system ascorbate-specific IIA component